MTAVDPLHMVRLHTGAVAPAGAVTATFTTLKRMLDDPKLYIPLIELRELADDPAYVPFGSAVPPLIGFGLLGGNGRLHAHIRDIVRAALVWDDGTLEVIDPVRGAA
ncbi:hypothetical protein AB0F72_09410 [Actinoplanes sp. NPDC023936]|uniref:hypothetical protein n=1 Tax=Actinoplanes sp. NPDC023936 TaxID=3154910 RepID=UPI0033D06387